MKKSVRIKPDITRINARIGFIDEELARLKPKYEGYARHSQQWLDVTSEMLSLESEKDMLTAIYYGMTHCPLCAREKHSSLEYCNQCDDDRELYEIERRRTRIDEGIENFD